MVPFVAPRKPASLAGARQYVVTESGRDTTVVVTEVRFDEARQHPAVRGNRERAFCCLVDNCGVDQLLNDAPRVSFR